MSPEDASKAFHDLKGKFFIPMHYGTFEMGAEEPRGEPIRIMRQIDETGQLKGKLCELAIGEEFRMDSNSSKPKCIEMEEKKSNLP